MKLVGWVALLAGGTAASSISGLGPAVKFIVKNDHFCPRTGSHQDYTWRLVDLYKVPFKLMTWLTDAVDTGHQLPGLSAIAKGVSKNFVAMDACLNKTESLKDFHLCYLAAVGFNPLYVSLFSCLPNYPEWNHLLPFNMEEPDPYQDEDTEGADHFSHVMMRRSPLPWTLESFLADFKSFRRQNEALQYCSSLLVEQSAKDSLETMIGTDLDAIQLDSLHVLVEFEKLSFFAPVPPTNPPMNPMDLALVILKHHAKYIKHQEILEILRATLRGAPFITTAQLRSILQQVSDHTGHEVDAPRRENFLDLLSASGEGDYSAAPSMATPWFNTLLKAIWDCNFARRDLLVSLLDVEFGLPQDIHDKVIERVINDKDFSMERLAQIAAGVKSEDQVQVMNRIIEISPDAIPKDSLQAMVWKHWKIGSRQDWQWLTLSPGLFTYQPVPPKYIPDLVVADTLRHTTIPLLDKMLICLHSAKSELQANLLKALLKCDPAVNDYSNVLSEAWSGDFTGQTAWQLKVWFKLPQHVYLGNSLSESKEFLHVQLVEAVKEAAPEFRGLYYSDPSRIRDLFEVMIIIKALASHDPSHALWIALNIPLMEMPDFDNLFCPDTNTIYTYLRSKCEKVMDPVEFSLVKAIDTGNWYKNAIVEYISGLTLAEVQSLHSLAQTDVCEAIRTIARSERYFPKSSIDQVIEDLPLDMKLEAEYRAKLELDTAISYDLLLDWLKHSNTEDLALFNMVYDHQVSQNLSEMRGREESCAICLNTIDGNGSIRVIKECQHTLHRSCLTQGALSKGEIDCRLCKQ